MYEAIIELGYTPGLEANPDSEGAIQSGAGVIPEPIASALSEATNQHKPLFVQFTAEWCIACRALEETTLNNPEVVAALSEYVVVKIDTDVSVEASAYFEVVGMPTLLVLDAEGMELTRLVGQIGPDALVSELQSLLVE